MRLGSVTFRPPLWAWLVTLPVLALLLWLGTWQIHRGEAKAAIIAERAAAGKTPAIPLARLQARAQGTGRVRVKLTGHWLAGRQLLLDNQVDAGRVGYHAWTPLRRADGRGLVLVDRGWVPRGRSRAQPPTPPAAKGVVTVTGLWRDWPRPGLRLGKQQCATGGWPRIVEYPTYPQVACNYDAPVADGLLLLDADAPGGFVRDWRDIGLPPMRHYGYAVQWFAMAAAVLVIFIYLNLRKSS